jgi:cysteine synthase A
VLHSEGAKVTRELFRELLATTERIARETGAFWTNQFENLSQVAGYRALGEELWDQVGGRLDAFVHVVGTCGSLRGVSTTLRRHQPKLRVVAVEPAESAVLSGGMPGAHRIEGVGIGEIPPLWEPGLAAGFEKVSTAEAEAMARRLAREEGVFAGTSSGANVVAALRVATVATILVDNGLKYLSTDVFRRD